MLRTGVLFCLIVCFIHILRIRRPYSANYRLSHHKGYWLLQDQNQQASKYEKAVINFEGGIFFLLTLTGSGSKKTLMIFYDQINSDDHRALMLL